MNKTRSICFGNDCWKLLKHDAHRQTVMKELFYGFNKTVGTIKDKRKTLWTTKWLWKQDAAEQSCDVYDISFASALTFKNREESMQPGPSAIWERVWDLWTVSQVIPQREHVFLCASEETGSLIFTPTCCRKEPADPTGSEDKFNRNKSCLSTWHELGVLCSATNLKNIAASCQHHLHLAHL